MTVQEATYFLRSQLSGFYSESEASAITRLVIEKVAMPKKPGRLPDKNDVLGDAEAQQLQEFSQRLQHHEPVQYVLNEAWFCGLRFYVDKNVLIPRPETDELVEWVISNCRFPIGAPLILDIGTGSGCIPVALKKRIRKAEVWSCDVSESALAVAKRNAEHLGIEVHLQHLDFLDERNWPAFPLFDLIVSNPPYVPNNDKIEMQPNVLNFEPHIALFVPDNDPLLFYRAIAKFGHSHLKPDGNIFLEIHETLGEAATALFRAAGYQTGIKKDMQGKERMLKAFKNTES